MKNKIIPIILLAGCFLVSSCGKKGGSTTSTSSSTSTSVPTHTHTYDTNNIVWNWSKSSVGFSATATLTCTSCEVSAEGHTLTLDAEVSSFNETEPTCTEPGLKKYKAEIVYKDVTYSNINPDYSMVLDPLGHQMEYTHDEQKHYYRCTREGCDYIESSENHTFSDWEIIKEADYGVDGLKKHHCEDENCLYEEEEVIPALVPTINVVQEAVNKANNDLCPLTGYRVSRAKRLYGLLSEDDKKQITGYDELLIQEAKYAENYDVVSNEVSPSSQVPEGKSLELITEKATDLEYGEIEKAVSFHTDYDWVSFYFNDETVDVSIYTKLSFYLYNPTENDLTILLGSDNWEYTNFNQKVSANSWGEITLNKEIFDEEITEGKLQKYFVGLNGYKGYELGEENIVMFSALYGKKSTQSDVDETISLINKIKNDGSKNDAYAIYVAEDKYETLSPSAKALVTNYEDLVNAKANAAYAVASALKPSQLAFTAGWSTTTSVSSDENEEKGHVTKIGITSTNGVAEFGFTKEYCDEFTEVSFAVYSPVPAKFVLSKLDWWRDAYDFSDRTWKTSGDNVTYVTSAGWNEFTIPTKDFKEASYFSAYFDAGEYEVLITPFYGKYTSQQDIDNVIDLIDKIPSDTSSLQMKDTYNIAKAKIAFDNLIPLAQDKVTNKQRLLDAIANCKYEIASFVDSTTLVLTEGWGANATVTDKEDQTKGHVSSLTLTAAAGALEYKFNKEALESGEKTVYFSVYTPCAARFTLSKLDWWRDAYDFSDSTWKTDGNNVSYATSAGWNDLSLPLADFLQVNYFTFYVGDCSVNDEIMVSTFYCK